MTIESMQLTQTDLIDLAGSGSVNLAGEVPLRQRRLPARQARIPRRVHQLHADHAGHHARARRPQDGRQFERRDRGARQRASRPCAFLRKTSRSTTRRMRLHLSKVNGDVHWRPAGVPDATRLEAFLVERRRLRTVRAARPISSSWRRARASLSRGPPNYPSSTARWPSTRCRWAISTARTWRWRSRARSSPSACRC